MADKDLKSLTIGATTFRNLFTDKDIGSWLYDSATANVPANTNVEPASVTITEPGSYLVFTYGTFYSATTTGATQRIVIPNFGYAAGNATMFTNADNSEVRIGTVQSIEFEASQLPINASVRLRSSKQCSAKGEIHIVKMAKYPGLEVVGGNP